MSGDSTPAAPALPGTAPRLARRVPWAVLVLALVALAASAWIHEDAYITFRVIENALDGRGLTWNPDERVQAYTHPLWLFLLVPLTALTGEHYLTTLALTAALSMATLYLVIFRAARSIAVGCAAVFALLLSKAFVDYATAGLEDSLTRLLIVLFVLRWIATKPDRPRDGLFLALLAALATLNRPDALLFFLPALGLLVAQSLRQPGSRRGSLRLLAWLALGFLPLALWGLFAFFYYGAPFPNTAYAKLGMGVPRPWLLLQSGFYLLNSLLRDPITLAVTVMACAVAFRRPDRESTPLVAGAALYLLYVVWIGGDYMSGRMLGIPFFLAVLALARHPLGRSLRRRPVLALALAVLALAPRIYGPFVLEGYGKVDAHGIGDERRLYYAYTGWIPSLGEERWPDHFFRDEGEAAHDGPSVHVAGTVGMLGFYAGPEIHVVDWHGLPDPLLARLPAIVTGPFVDDQPTNWRPGHGWRPIPEGYLDSLREDENRIEDPDLARYYEVIRRVTRGELWDLERLKLALELNLGRYDAWRDAWVAAHPEKLERMPDR